MTTVHAYTASQSVVDTPQTHPRRGCAAAANLVSTSTGAALVTSEAAYLNIVTDSMARPSGTVTIGSPAHIVALEADRRRWTK